MDGDRVWLLTVLDDAGVAGAQDFGRFVSNTDYFRPSDFDERAAMPVLVQALPLLSDPAVVGAVAGHLRRKWARPAAFEAMLAAYRRWGAADVMSVGWHLADAVVNASELRHLDPLLELAGDRRYGESRQMLVFEMWRFRKDVRVAPALAILCADPDVALHAMSAYRRAVGNDVALPLLRALLTHDDPVVRQQATREVKKVAKVASARND